MAEYIEREAVLKEVDDLKKSPWYNDDYGFGTRQARHDGVECVVDLCIKQAPAADVVEVVHGEWVLEIKSFYMDNWDESIELCVYILANCSKCGENHNPKQVFSKHLYAPEDADDDFRFDQEYERTKALEEFKQKDYKFQNFCPNCGAKMDGDENG